MKGPRTTDELDKAVLENMAKIEEIRNDLEEIQKTLHARAGAAVRTEPETEGA